MGPTHTLTRSFYKIHCCMEARKAGSYSGARTGTYSETQIGQCVWKVHHPNDQCSSLGEDAEERVLALCSFQLSLRTREVCRYPAESKAFCLQN